MALSAVRTPMSVKKAEFGKETVPINIWAASTAYVVGQVVRSSAGSGNYYQCSVAGTSGASAPTWTTTGTTVSDNTVTWQDIGVGYGGDLVLRPNGLVAYIDGLAPRDQYQTITFTYVGVVECPKASATHFVDGTLVYFNTATGLAITTSPVQGFIVGTARGDWGSGSTVVRVALNGGAGLLFSSNTLTFSGTTGNNIVVFPENQAQGLLVKDATGDVWITVASTEGSESVTFAPGALTTLKLETAASAVNYVDVTPAATNSGPTVAAAGTDTNIDINLSGKGSSSVVISSATTPYLKTATGGTNTGYVEVDGKTSGGVRVTCADACAFLLTINVAARTVGTATLTVPDTANVADTFALVTLAQTLANKTLTSPVVSAGLTASGSGSNDFSASTGTFKTSSGANQLTGATTITDATTPSLTTAAGSTNTGFLQVNGKTSGGVKIIPADATAFLLTISIAARTVGTATITVPDTANVADTFCMVTLAQTLANKTLTAPVISGGLTASGSAANDFSASTGTFKTSTGVNTFGGNTACVVGASVTAAGASQAAATALSEGDLVLAIGVTGQAGYGVKFPSASFAGKRVRLVNTSAFAFKLYPYGTENIGAGASTAVTIGASTTYDIVFPTAGTGYVDSVGSRVTS